jgi:zinc transporter 9
MPKRMHIHDAGRNDCAQGGAIRGLNATLGLVIHGAADGIALGASSLSDKGNLGLIVFVAVLVHKGESGNGVADIGPTALGLTTTLLSLGLDHPGIRKRLIIFSFAAPLGAILTFSVINAFGASSLGSGEIDGLQWWTGVALLFSVSVM